MGYPYRVTRGESQGATNGTKYKIRLIIMRSLKNLN